MPVGPVRYEGYGMTVRRYYYLMKTPNSELTPQELKDGWYWSREYDDLLVNRNWEGHEDE